MLTRPLNIGEGSADFFRLRCLAYSLAELGAMSGEEENGAPEGIHCFIYNKAYESVRWL